MFGFSNKDKSASQSKEKTEDTELSPESKLNAIASEEAELGLFPRLKHSLSRTRGRLSEGLTDLVLGVKKIDDDLLDDVEAQLLSADVGIEATDQIIANLKKRLSQKQLFDSAEFIRALKIELQEILKPCDVPLKISNSEKPFVILIIGVNGVGKTTTIGKLAKRFQSQGHSVMLAAGDTFRAAAVEQLQVWGERNSVPVVAQTSGADSASVIFDAYESAKARKLDILVADTAGRLHTKNNLMNELEKIVRVLKKQDDRLPDEIILVLDATTGQNALNQAESFHSTVNLSGLILTKLDGTAKGGVVFALAKRLSLPIRFIGIGEQVDDLRPFDSQQFVEALFSK
ncbi:MAG TPA: signal recognition particle-docking protein FtsY [Porticoccaceae bacterium]|jgi:fused signal recognition particle receptor|nr:signal recognition particle-docking protein FtsY [Gammaproteobacteria bacterium]HIL61194.1 signal recognition particle-docking protein FtsY [Porticoccaceae bacterium]